MRQTSANDTVSKDKAESRRDNSMAPVNAKEVYGRIKAGEKAYRDAEVLRFLYHEAGLSLQQISNLFEVTRQTISNWMQNHDIQRRGMKEGFRLRQIQEMDISEEKEASIEDLRRFLD